MIFPPKFLEAMQNNFTSNPNYKPNFKEFLGCMYLTTVPSDLEKMLKVIYLNFISKNINFIVGP